MKTFVLVMIAVLVSPVWGAPFDNGAYKGKGYFKASNKMKGATSTVYIIKNNVIDVTYTWGSSTKSYKLERKPTFHNMFDLFEHGKKVGDGYCGQSWCHLVIESEFAIAEETIRFTPEGIYRLGSITSDKLTMWYEDFLTPVLIIKP